MTRPQLRSRMPSHTWRVTLNAEVRSMSITCCHWSFVILWKGASRVTPALLTTISIGPRSFRWRRCLRRQRHNLQRRTCRHGCRARRPLPWRLHHCRHSLRRPCSRFRHGCADGVTDTACTACNQNRFGHGCSSLDFLHCNMLTATVAETSIAHWSHAEFVRGYAA